MAHDLELEPRIEQPPDVQRTARIAGLKGFATPTLEQIDKRRFELLGITFFLLVAFSVAIVIVSYIRFSADWLQFFGGVANVVRVSLVALAFGFSLYVMDKERTLRKLSKILINERVLSAALSNRLKEISLLTEAGKAVISMLELEDVLGVILRSASELLESDEGSVLLVEGDELVVATAVGHPNLYLGQRHKMHEGLSGYVARTREPILVERRSDAGHEDLLKDTSRINSAMCVPLQALGELFGVLNLNVIDGDRRYNEYDLRAAGLFAEHAAMAIRHARVLRREREMRVHIAELDRIRAELVASVAHDLKTPLTTILGFSKLLYERADELPESKRHEFLGSIDLQAKRLLGLIDRLLEAARSQARHLPLRPAPIDMTLIVRTQAKAIADARGRAIDVRTPERPVEAYADRDAVEQVLSNLLENALKYTPPEAPVGIDLHSAGDAVSCAVRDGGPGIAPEDVPFLFLPFRRAQTVGPGVGLGLFIVSNLVRAMGGDVDVRSQLGEGTTFTFTLPVQPPEPKEESAT